MRLDHLLSKEYRNRKVSNSGQQEPLLALFDFEDVVRRQMNIWGCSSAGRAPALHAGGQEFDPPHLHQNGRIAQVVRAHA